MSTKRKNKANRSGRKPGPKRERPLPPVIDGEFIAEANPLYVPRKPERKSRLTKDS